MDGQTLLLCVDAGNSFVKYALTSRTRCVSLGSQPTKGAAARRLPAEARRRVRQLAAVDGVIVSSVVPSLARSLSRELRRATGKHPIFVDHRLTFPFELRVAGRARLGIDRICAAVGAVRHGARAVIIIDVGSAITVDLVAHRLYRGGLILAGPGLALQALGTFTEQLPVIRSSRLRNPHQRFEGTQNSMVTGAIVGAVGAIRETVRHLDASIRQPARKVVTGGGAAAIVDHLPRSWRFDPHLVQNGLYHIWQLNFAPPT